MFVGFGVCFFCVCLFVGVVDGCLLGFLVGALWFLVLWFVCVCFVVGFGACGFELGSENVDL